MTGGPCISRHRIRSEEATCETSLCGGARLPGGLGARGRLGPRRPLRLRGGRTAARRGKPGPPRPLGSPAARESAMLVQSIRVNGTVVRLERVEDTDDHFMRVPTWLARSGLEFPGRTLGAGEDQDIFSCVGFVLEIDPFCIPGPGFDRPVCGS